MTFLLAVFAVGQSKQISADEVVKRMQRAYDSVKCLDLRAKDSAFMSGDEVDVEFKRPGKWFIGGSQRGGIAYGIQCDGHSTYLDANGSRTKEPSLKQAIAIADKLTKLGVPLPVLIISHDEEFRKVLEGPKTVNLTNDDDRQLYRVSFKEPYAFSLWIDPKTYLAVKTTIDLSSPLVTDCRFQWTSPRFSDSYFSASPESDRPLSVHE